MKAIVITEPGYVEAMKMINIDPPIADSGEVRIRILAAAVNPVDLHTRDGFFHRVGWIKRDRVGLGWDLAGVIDEVGAGVDRFRIGQRVAGMVDGLDVPTGAYAEQVVLSESVVAPIPDALGPVAAATMPLNATTAAQAVEQLGRSSGDRLLITGAAGGVGGFAVPLAAAQGWRVTGLARAEDRDFVIGAGAAELITELPERTYDAVLDAAVLTEPALAAVRDGGRYLTLMPAAPPKSYRPITIEPVKVKADGARLEELLDLAARGTLSTRIAGTMPLADAATAHRWQAKGGTRGRWVLLP